MTNESPHDTPHDPRLGTLFEGRYRIESLLGRGGFGAVYRAVQLGVERPVGLKILMPELATDPREIARFQQEARVIAALDHPYIVKLIELGQASDGSIFIAMEYLEGEPLSRYLRREAPLPMAEVQRFGMQVLEALGEAHAAGVVHRDLKPENLFVTNHPRRGTILKLLDFGIAKVSGDSAAGMSLTRTGTVIGSPRTMAPEQLKGAEVTARTDLYAFGIVAYEMLTGHPPFLEQTPAAYLHAHLYKAPEWPAVDGEALEGPLVDLVMQCLEKEPAARPASAEAMLERWQEASAGPGGGAQRANGLAEAGVGRVTRPIGVSGVATSTVQRPPKRKTWPLWAGLGALVVVGGVTAAVVATQDDASTVEATPIAALDEGVVRPTPREAPAPARPEAEPDVALAKAETPPAPAGLVPDRPKSKRAQARELEASCKTRVIGGECMPESFTTAAETTWIGIDTSLWMTRSEVTAAQYAACVAAKQCSAAEVRKTHPPRHDELCNYERRPDHPMNCVTHTEAAAYCAWQGGALPTREQWRLEATQNTSPVPRLYPWGSADPSCATTVMKDASGPACGKASTWAACEHAGDRTVNGLCDMGGNVREWVADVPPKVATALGPAGRAMVGGAFDDDNPTVFSEHIFSGTPDNSRDIAMGFRCVRSTR